MLPSLKFGTPTRRPSQLYQRAFFHRENAPLAGGQTAEPELSDADTNQTQRRMANDGGHSPHLPVFTFNQFQANPAIRHAFAETDGRDARRDLAWQGRAGSPLRAVGREY